MERRKKANTPLEQIYFNTQDIKQLEEAIAPFYNCSIDLSNDSVSVAVSNTNLPTDITKAYITDYNGNVYKFIAFNDDKTTAYIEYYASLKGADGRDGAEDIDDTTTANNKLWSSEKTNNEILNKSDKAIYYTTEAPTETSGILSYNINQLVNKDTNINVKINDLIIYVDNNKTKELYRVISVIDATNSIVVLKIADFGGGTTTKIFLSMGAGTYDAETSKFLIPITYLRNLDGTQFNISDFDENNENLILYIDMSSQDIQDVKLKAVYNFRGIDYTTEPNNAICNIEMQTGKQRYKHYLYVQCYNTSNSKMLFQLMFSIENDSNVEITTRAEIENEIFNILGRNSNVARDMSRGAITATGFIEGNGQYNIFGIVTGLAPTLVGETQVYYVFSNASTSINYSNFPNDTQYPNNVYTIKDIVKPA